MTREEAFVKWWDSLGQQTIHSKLTSELAFQKGWDAAIASLAPPKGEIPYNEIIEMMNQMLDKKFKKTPTTCMHIHARWNEGFRIPDFEKVIRIKKHEWAKDPDMEKFLRPETLFGTKMNGYCQQKDFAKEQKDPDWL